MIATKTPVIRSGDADKYSKWIRVLPLSNLMYRIRVNGSDLVGDLAEVQRVDSNKKIRGREDVVRCFYHSNREVWFDSTSPQILDV